MATAAVEREISRMSGHVIVCGFGRVKRNLARYVAGADRVVNPQGIGGARMAAFVRQPHVAEFLDVVMHDGSSSSAWRRFPSRRSRRWPASRYATPTSGITPGR